MAPSRGLLCAAVSGAQHSRGVSRCVGCGCSRSWQRGGAFACIQLQACGKRLASQAGTAPMATLLKLLAASKVGQSGPGLFRGRLAAEQQQRPPVGAVCALLVCDLSQPCNIACLAEPLLVLLLRLLLCLHSAWLLSQSEPLMINPPTSGWRDSSMQHGLQSWRFLRWHAQPAAWTVKL